MNGHPAFALARAGLHVLILRPFSKLPATEHGCLDATTDEAMLAATLSVVGTDANVGIACGPSGLVVIDIDNAEAADHWKQFQSEHGPAPTLTVKTVRGWHCYYRAPHGVEVRNSCSRVAPGIDVRAQGGYVVAPPSRVVPVDGKPGGSYKWARNGITKAAELPRWALPLALPPVFEPVPIGPPVDIGDRYVDAAVRGEVTRVTSAAVGTRNMALRAASFALGRLVGAGVLAHGVAEQQLRAAGEAVGLGAVETGRTVARGLRDGALEPRQIQRRAVAA